jgi:hypothetical protein
LSLISHQLYACWPTPGCEPKFHAVVNIDQQPAWRCDMMVDHRSTFGIHR